jgi:diadenosine tetraphosphate (Ap4A) HIT family hydrolase
MNCTICHLLTTDSDRIIHESALWRVVINPNQEYIGRLYITLKAHRSSLGTITPTEWHEFTQLTAWLESTLTGLFQPTHFNWLCLLNDAIRDQESPHVHWHLIPRYATPILFQEQTFHDQAWPHKYTTNQPRQLNEPTLNALHVALREAFAAAKSKPKQQL